jgi:photosystem II stability/assembly factor-like uncharacterized protein
MNSYILAFLLLFTISSPLPDRHPGPKTEKAGLAKIVFKSADGGQTWQDISKGLPENLREDGIRGNRFFANDKGQHSSITPGKSGISANSYWGVNLKTTNGTSVWSPIFENFQEPRIRSTFETAGGTIFIGIDRGLFRSTDDGKTWKHVYAGGLVGHLAASDGVLVATSMRKIIRSTDNGENWEFATSEDGVAFDVKPIKGGFVAMTSTSASNPRGLMTSCDSGKTWQSLYSGLQGKVLIDSIWRTWNDRPLLKAFQTSITQVGENFFCTHPDGIFRSSDKGKTWKLLLPSVDSKGFNLFVSGHVIYAIRSKGGC